MKDKLGVVTKKGDGFEVKFERILPFDIHTVWKAITEPKQLALWFTDIEMDFKPGGKITIWFRDENRTESSGRIVRLEAPRLFEYTWEGELATWELFPLGPSSCKLVLTYSKLPDQYAISVPAGWHILLDQLETVLNGRTEPYPFGEGETEQGKAMKAVYEEVFQKGMTTNFNPTTF